MKKTMICFAVAVLAAGARAVPYSEGDRVVFYGDSVTHHGHYVTPIQTFYYTRYPDRDIRIWNCGVGGETSGEALWRFDVDILARRPTAATVLFGMNDVCVLGYQPDANEMALRRRREAPASFEANMRKIFARFRQDLPGTKLTWCTLVPWDDELKFVNPRPPITGVTAGERPLCEFVKRFQKEVGGGYVDYYTPMLAYNRKLHAQDPYASLSPDTIHPKEPGGLFMARIFLKAQGHDGIVSDVCIDAKTLKAKRAKNAEVSAVARAGGGIAFTVLEKALPFPVNPAARALADDIGFDAALNREMLSVAGLAAGDWVLSIDGANVVTKSAAEWAKGVNLATCDTPMMEQSREVSAKVEERRAKEREVRDMMVARVVALRWLGIGVPFAEGEKGKDDRFAQAFAAGYMKACRDAKVNPPDSHFEPLNRNWQNRQKMEAAIEAMHLEIRKLNHPTPHRFVLEKKGK